MFCSNCGAVLAEGAKFCSECGTKVEETQAKVVGTSAFEEPTDMQEKIEERAMSMEEAFREKVSFDWSNVIDEPQKKEVPQEVKSPWAATTGNIDERDLYAEMGKSDDKNRTMNFIDVLKADKEERERAARDKSIEYTEVFEIDPELVGGVKPPKLHYAPLYEDVDEPVKTPFDFDETVDAYATGQLDRLHIEEKAGEDALRAEAPAQEPAAPKFELPDFLRKAKDFVGTNDNAEVERIEKPGITAEEPVAETIDDVEEVVEDKVDKSVTAVAEDVANPLTDDTANLYLDLDVLSSDAGTERVSRATAHALAGDYDDDDSEIEAFKETEFIDENELFGEMNESPGAKSGMTIAPPADEEAEIKALKRRLAELTGTVEIDPSLINNAETENDAEPETEDYSFELEASLSNKASDFAAPGLDDFFFEPEVTPAEDKFFEGLAAASESVASKTEVSYPVVEKTSIEPQTAESYEAQRSALDNLSFDFPSQEVTREPETPVQSAEPEISKADALFADLETQKVGALFADLETQKADALFADLETQKADATLAEAEAQKAEVPIAEHEAQKADATLAEAEVQKADATLAEPEAQKADVPAVEPETHTVGLVPEPAVIDFASMMAEKSVDEPPKPTDAVSLSDLENDIFGSADDDEQPEAETTKKIDKFYTLYRKNEEFQRLLDEEYSRLKGDHIEISEEEVNRELGISDTESSKEAEIPSVAAMPADAVAAEKTAEETSPAAASIDITAALEDISASSRPAEDATIYQMNMPEELKALSQSADEKTGAETVPVAEAPADKTEKKSKGLFGKNKDKKNKKKDKGETSFGLNGEEVASAAAATTAAAAATAIEAADSSAQHSAQPEEAYQDVDSGSTMLTILAVLVAILLVFLLAIILIMHLAPYSNVALMVDQVIENITSRFGAVDTMQGLKLL